jgi:predicted O-methyltransferase YrrM
MSPKKLNVFFSFFPYAGNGATSAEHPAIRDWYARSLTKLKDDPRVGDIKSCSFSDTPITMTRNLAVETAKAAGADIIIMCDSDQHPDVLLGKDPLAKPFVETAFDFIYKNHDRGPVVIGAPYCGPPPNEYVYVFRWASMESDNPNLDVRLEMFPRECAAERTGIEAVAALPTGMIAYDMRAFDLIDKPYFYYEFEGDGNPCPQCSCRKPGAQSTKASTEDVTNTRDISMHGAMKLGYSPVFVAWDCWAGHYKPKCVGKPVVIHAGQVQAKFRDAVLRKAGAPLESVNVIGASETKQEHAFQKLGNVTSEADLKAIGDLAALATLRAQYNGRPVRILEVGSWVGESSRAIADAIGEAGTLICVDHWNGSSTDTTSEWARAAGPDGVFNVFQKNMASYIDSGAIMFERKDSLTAAEEYNGPQFDLIYLDAGHTKEELAADIKAWWPHLRVDGILAGHDYGIAFPGVKEAVDGFVSFMGHEVAVSLSGDVVWSIEMSGRDAPLAVQCG